MSGDAVGYPAARMRRAYRAGLWAYLLGCLIWLVLGALPLVEHLVPPLHRALQLLAASGGSVAVYAGRVLVGDMAPQSSLDVALAYLFSAFNLTLGLLLLLRRPPGIVPPLLALAFLGTAATFNEPSHQVFHVLGDPWPVKAIHFTFHVVSGVAYLWAVLLFPDGRLPFRRTLPPSAVWTLGFGVTAAIALICWRSSFLAHPPFFVAFFGVLVPTVGVLVQTKRLRLAPDATSAMQSRLLRAALLPALAAAVGWLAAQAMAPVAGAEAARWALVVQSLFPALFAVVPMVMFVAIVRYRLWDIDVIASKVLVFALLVALVGLVYVGTLALTGWWLRGNGWLVLVPLVIVACIAEPMRAWAQRQCNRLVFGTRTSPQQALRFLVDRFSGVGDVDELTELTMVVVDSTRATSATLWLLSDRALLRLAAHPRINTTERTPLPAATFAACQAVLAPARCWPVRYEGELLGILAMSTGKGVALTSAEVRLIDDLAHHAGLLVANARLTVDLAHRLAVVQSDSAELQVSRREVVRAQDEQRRRLEADIHDGAQQFLVALLVELGVLEKTNAPGPPAPERLARIRMLLAGAAETLAEIAAGGAPRVLVESGLEAALNAAAETARQVGLVVEVRCDTAALRNQDGQTTAVYFCCLEALQNTLKHAQASRLWIDVRSDREGGVSFEVRDDGVGYSLSGLTGGSGLGNLGARVAAQGGHVDVWSAPGSGTVVRGSLPVPVDADVSA